MTKGDWGI